MYISAKDYNKYKYKYTFLIFVCFIHGRKNGT